jgi:hypothetical protein
MHSIAPARFDPPRGDRPRRGRPRAGPAAPSRCPPLAGARRTASGWTPASVLELQRSAGNRMVARAASRVLARHPAQDRIEALDRVEHPPADERAATELGRTGARIDRLAQQHSPATLSNLVTVLGDLAEPEDTLDERLSRGLTFLRLLEHGLITYDPRLGRYRSNLRDTAEFEAVRADGWLYRRFEAGWLDESEDLDAWELLDLAALTVPVVLGLLGTVARNVARLTRRGRRIWRVTEETLAFARRQTGGGVVAAGTFEPVTNRVYFATNRTPGPAEWHPLLRDLAEFRVVATPFEATEANRHLHRHRGLVAGQRHAELASANEALWARARALGRPLERAELRELITDIRWLRGRRRLQPAPRCEGCVIGLDEIEVTPAVRAAEREWFQREMRDAAAPSDDD